MTTTQKTNRKALTVVKSNVASPLSTAYDGLSPDVVKQIKEQAAQARLHLTSINAAGVALGEALSVIKSLAGTEGRFKYILKEESINMSETWAYDMIHVYTYYQSLDVAAKLQFILLALSSQQLLASPSPLRIVR